MNSEEAEAVAGRTTERDRGPRERDMVLAPNEFMFILDRMKGHVDVFVGPTKSTLSNTDQPVVYDETKKRFVESEYKPAKQYKHTAPEGSYLIVENPPEKGGEYPVMGGGKQGAPKLAIGKKVNIPGPASLYLWPEQSVAVVKGHHLRSNQYLLVQVYDEAAAQENWGKAVMKPADGTTPGAAPIANGSKLTMGQVIVIKGTDVSFYIPPTGVEVVADAEGNLVRDAVTLERLEYCLLMDESGKKRYERGPAVVFPEPTEVFVERDESRKARAIELNENIGIYVKVIADYVDDDGEGRESVAHEVGEELFITGADQMIYFPREEHAIIKYGAHDRHYGIAIPAGEARYVLDRTSGEVALVKGPKMFLPDPRREVIVRRVLDPNTCAVLYPGSEAAKAANAAIAGISKEEYALGYYLGASGPMGATGAQGPFYGIGNAMQHGMNLVGGAMAFGGRTAEPEVNMLYASTGVMPSISNTRDGRGLAEKAGTKAMGDELQRKGQFTPPRSLTLDTKYEGAVAVDVWTGYAMMLVRKSGERRVVVGPKTVLLEYDEAPQVLSLSSGKPKSTDIVRRTAYLRVKANWVTDLVHVETRDFCQLSIKLSYRLNFEGDPEKWFDVENYVKHLCDHMRSKLRAAVQRAGVEEFYADHAAFIRDVVLGKAADGKPRDGAKFDENGMRVYDVEVLGLEMKDAQIAQMMSGAQRQAVSTSIQLATQRRALEVTRETEKLKQEEAEVRAATQAKALEIQEEEIKLRLVVDLTGIEAEAKRASDQSILDKAREEVRTALSDIVVARETRTKEAAIAIAAKTQAMELAALKAEVDGLVAKAAAISPELIAALQAFGDKLVAEGMAKSMGPMAILGGESLADVVAKLFRDTPLAKHLLQAKSPNGHVSAPGAAE